MLSQEHRLTFLSTLLIHFPIRKNKFISAYKFYKFAKERTVISKI